jgi:hypothetical protein
LLEIGRDGQDQRAEPFGDWRQAAFVENDDRHNLPQLVDELGVVGAGCVNKRLGGFELGLAGCVYCFIIVLLLVRF